MTTTDDIIEVREEIADELYDVYYHDKLIGYVNNLNGGNLLDDPRYQVKIYDKNGDKAEFIEGLCNFKYAIFLIIKYHKLHSKEVNYINLNGGDNA